MKRASLGKSLNPKDKKEEEKKDMRGYYAKINVIKNKIRAKGMKDPCILADPDEVEKIWDKDKKKDVDEGYGKAASSAAKILKNVATGGAVGGAAGAAAAHIMNKKAGRDTKVPGTRAVNAVKRTAAGVANFLDQEKAATEEDGAKVRELKKNPRYKWGTGK